MDRNIRKLNHSSSFLEISSRLLCFGKKRFQLKRMCYLLINLPVDDLMVGVGNIKNVASEILKMTNSSCKTGWTEYIALDEFCRLCFNYFSCSYFFREDVCHSVAISYQSHINTELHLQHWGSVAHIGNISWIAAVT